MVMTFVILLFSFCISHKISERNQPAIDFYQKLGAEINHTEQNCDLIF